METKNCPKCGRLFTYVKNSICPDCLKEEEETFQRVRAYLKEFPGQSISQVSEATGVPPRKISKYLRDGRLEVTDGLSGFLTCMNCGKPIHTGKFCRECSTKLSKGFQSVAANPKETEKNGPRMHHLKNKDKE